jgi:hypothetical protein
MKGSLPQNSEEASKGANKNQQPATATPVQTNEAGGMLHQEQMVLYKWVSLIQATQLVVVFKSQYTPARMVLNGTV